jgi:hypothetical protein
MYAFKKACFIFILITVFSLFSVVSVAWGDTTTYSRDVQETGAKFFTVSRPLVSDSTTSKSFFVCGNIVYDWTTVETFIYSGLEERYIPFTNIEGESSCQISSSGFFNNEISLPNKGDNKLLIVAYRTSEPENKQFSKFTVALRSESFTERFINGLDKALDFFANLLP